MSPLPVNRIFHLVPDVAECLLRLPGRLQAQGRFDLHSRHILTILAVADFERAVAFYRAAFGWPAKVDVPVYVEFELPDGRGLGVYKREAFALNTGQAPALPAGGAISGAELYFHCDDLPGAIGRMEAAGGRLLSALAPRGWGDEAAYYADPDGNVLVLARPLS